MENPIYGCSFEPADDTFLSGPAYSNIGDGERRRRSQRVLDHAKREPKPPSTILLRSHPRKKILERLLKP